jgi:hypothetical protein
MVGLGDDRARIRRAVKHASFETLAALERRDGFAEASSKTTRFFREGAAGQWRGVMTPLQVSRVFEQHRAQMARFGYLPDVA